MKQPTAIYSTVARSDHLGFYADQVLNARSVVDFLDLNQHEIARIAQVSPASVRYDDKIPKELLQRIEEIANVCGLVADFFNGDAAKTALWFKTPNPQFGNISPRDMIRYGRYKKLLQYVLVAGDANRKAISAVKHGSPSSAETT
jgi:Protein of unknown function (DUF2384)